MTYDPSLEVDPDPRERQPLSDEAILAKVARIEEHVAQLAAMTRELELEKEVLITQNKVLHEAHEADRKEIVRLLRTIEALSTEQPEDDC